MPTHHVGKAKEIAENVATNLSVDEPAFVAILIPIHKPSRAVRKKAVVTKSNVRGSLSNTMSEMLLLPS